jgi:hypothetical protein
MRLHRLNNDNIIFTSNYSVFNLKVDRQLSREYFKSDAIYNGSAGMTLYYCVCRVYKTVAGDGRTGHGHPYQLNQSTVSAGVWTTPFLRFHNAVNSGRIIFILESYLKTMSYAHCSQSFFEKFRRKAPVKNAILKMIKKWKNAKKVARNMVKRVDKCIEMNGHHFQHLL